MTKVKVSAKNNIPTSSQTRSELFEFLLEKEFKILDEVSYLNGLYIFAVMIISIIYSCFLLLIPQHDAIKNPNYWYETGLIIPSVLSVYYVLSILQECNIYFGIKSMLTVRTAINLTLSVFIGFTVPYCLCYIIWTIFLEFNYPIPFVVFCGYPMAILIYTILWFEFPYDLRKNNIFRKRLQMYIFSLVWVVVIHFQYSGLSAIFAALPLNLQWIMAIILPILRYINLQVYQKLVEKYAGRDNKMAMIRNNISIAIDYSMFIAVMLSSATNITLFIILGFESLLNIYLCFKILRLHRKIRTDCLGNESWKEEIKNNIHSLVLGETIEVLAPLTYFGTFLIAYMGPNSTILGGIGNSYWDYEKVEDLGKILIVGAEMFFLDFASFLFCGMILYKFCRINLFQEFCKIIRQCWTIMTILISGKLVSVRNNSRKLI